MPSKFDLLRQGKAVEFEPGVSGLLNKEKKTLELSNGEVLNAANDPDFFPSNEHALKVSKQKEHLEKKTRGFGGEFYHQFSSSFAPTKGGSDLISYLTQAGDDYVANKQAENQVSERISEESPYVSLGAQGAAIGAEIGLTGGMSAARAAPLLHAAGSGSRLITEPREVIGESAIAGALGKGLDLTGKYFSNVAKRRGEIRNLPELQENVRNSNILGKQANDATNAVESQNFNMLKQNVKNVNETRLKNFQDDLNIRQNRIIQEKNAFENAKLARDNEVIRLKNEAQMLKAQKSVDVASKDSEYLAAKNLAETENKIASEKFQRELTEYETKLKELPSIQKKAQEEYSKNVLDNASTIDKSFHKNSKFSSDDLQVEEFIDQRINKSGIAGSKDANQANRFLKSIFPEGELITGRELSSRYKDIEDAIKRSSPEVKSILNDFKTHLGERLPTIIEDSIAFNKITPLLKRSLENDVKTILNELNLGEDVNRLFNISSTNIKNILRSESSSNFIERLQSGELSKNIAKKIVSVEDFIKEISPERIKALKLNKMLPVMMQEAEKKHAYFVNELSKMLEKKLARYEIKALQSAKNTTQKLGKNLKNTFGLAEEISSPTSPIRPEPIPIPSKPIHSNTPEPPLSLPPEVPLPQTPSLPSRPGLINEPNQPLPQQFSPQPIPNLGGPQGFAERTGDLLEKNIMGGNGIINNPLTKLAGLKYLFGKAALPIEAAYGGAKLLTSPTIAGEAARISFKQGGIQAIESWAQKYPSYQNGILQSPQDRRSLTKEIEDAYDIPIEQKAILQSKVNRGKPLEGSLQ